MQSRPLPNFVTEGDTEREKKILMAVMSPSRVQTVCKVHTSVAILAGRSRGFR